MSRDTGRTPTPTRLRVVGATNLERRLLDAAARELPSVELTQRMQKALGISIAAGTLGMASTAAAKSSAAASSVAAKSSAAAGAGAGAATPAFVWPTISLGVLALAVTGGVVGLRATAIHHPAETPTVVLAAPPTPLPAPVVESAVPAVAPTSAAMAPTHEPAAARPALRPALHARHHAAPRTPADLRAEIALVDAARSAVTGGANERALALVQRYDASYPTGTFRPEAAALRIEALDHLGRTAQAHALAEKFIAAHPESPLRDRVARATGLAER